MRMLMPIGCLILAAACTPSTIPGTQIPDKPDLRAVLEVLSRYKTAAEALDSEQVLALAAPAYFDKGDAGRPGTARDLAGLKKTLPAEFQRLKSLKMEITVKDARVAGDDAEVDYFVVLHYALNLPSGEKWRSDSDDARLHLTRVGGQWKVTAGL